MRPQPLLLAATVLLAIAVLAGCALHPAKPAAAPTPPAANTGPNYADAAPPMPVIPQKLTSYFLGDRVCAGCHPDVARAHDASTHAHTLRKPDSAEILKTFRTSQTFEDPALKVRYAFKVADGKPVFHVERTTSKSAIDVTPRYAVGSGHMGRTYLLEKGGVYMEGRTSWYSEAGKWSWTPGQQGPQGQYNPVGSTLTKDRTMGCFFCHSTTLVMTNDKVDPDHSTFNIGCERCHGSGKEHVAQAEKGNAHPGAIYSYRAAKGETVMALCGLCHRAPVEMTEAQLAHFDELPRFSAPSLRISKCFKASNGALQCLTCHDPHTLKVASFDQPCLSCHTAAKPKTKLCPVNQVSGCVNCHMPKKSVNLPVDRPFRSHWIKVWR